MAPYHFWGNSSTSAELGVLAVVENPFWQRLGSRDPHESYSPSVVVGWSWMGVALLLWDYLQFGGPLRFTVTAWQAGGNYAQNLCTGSSYVPIVPFPQPWGPSDGYSCTGHFVTEYCNALYTGLPFKAIQKLQLVENVVVWAVTHASYYAHTSLLIWLPVKSNWRSWSLPIKPFMA